MIWWMPRRSAPTTSFRLTSIRLTFFGDIKKIPFWHNTVPIATLAYRKDFVDEAGLSHPSTEEAWESYDDLWEWAGKLQGAGRERQHYALGDGTTIGLAWAGFSVLGGVLDQGGHWWDEGKQEFTLNTAEVVNALQTIYFDPVYTYGVSYDNANQPEVPRNERLFEGVVAASHMNWPILIALDKGMMDMVEILGYAEIPGMAPGQHNYCYEGTWGAGIVASAPAEHHDAAFQLATMQLQPEVARVIMEIAGAGVGAQELPGRSVPGRVGGETQRRRARGVHLPARHQA